MSSNRQVVFKGRIVQLNIETVELPNGRILDAEIVNHPGGAAVVALDAARRVCLLRQFRAVVNDWLWELPAGKIDEGEPPFETARRELMEEAGVGADTWIELGTMFSSPGVFTEEIHLYLAQGIKLFKPAIEESEIIEVHWLPFKEALLRAGEGVITDAKSVVGLFRAQARLQKSGPG